MRGFPVTLVGLASERRVVVGGGRVAARKVASLIEAAPCAFRVLWAGR